MLVNFHKDKSDRAGRKDETDIYFISNLDTHQEPVYIRCTSLSNPVDTVNSLSFSTKIEQWLNQNNMLRLCEVKPISSLLDQEKEDASRCIVLFKLLNCFI